jgi:hypothetical protein
LPRSRIGQVVGTKSFFIGLCSGAVLVSNWRAVLKAGVKSGLRIGAGVQRAAVRGAENVADVTHEARSEIDVDRVAGNSYHPPGAAPREKAAPPAL